MGRGKGFGGNRFFPSPLVGRVATSAASGRVRGSNFRPDPSPGPRLAPLASATLPARGEGKWTSALVSARGFLAGASSRPFGLRLREFPAFAGTGRGRAGRRGLPVPTVLCRRSRETQEVFPQGAGYPPASRARCLRLAPHEPRWTYRAPLSRPMLIHRWRASSALRPTLAAPGGPKEGPCDARQARRAHAAWTAAIAGALRPRRRPPPPTPRQKNALETPLGWGGMCGI